MNRTITVQNREGALPWRAHMSEDTTVGELELAVSLLKLDIIRTTADEILLVQTDEAIKDGVPPPDIQELAMVMFGPESDQATLVEETGSHRTIDEAEAFDQEATDRHEEHDSEEPALSA